MTDTEIHDVIESLIETVARLYDLLRDTQSDIRLYKRTVDDLQRENNRLDNDNNQLREQNRLLLLDVNQAENKIQLLNKENNTIKQQFNNIASQLNNKGRDPKTGKFVKVVKK